MVITGETERVEQYKQSTRFNRNHGHSRESDYKYAVVMRMEMNFECKMKKMVTSCGLERNDSCVVTA